MVKFAVKKLYFLGSCLHSFSNSWQNAVYQKRYVFTEFFKHLAISNHLSFWKKTSSYAFTDDYAIVQFWRLKVTCFAQKWRFWTPVCAPLGPKLRPLGHPFRQKGPQRCSTPVGPWPLLADPGATSGPKRPRLRFHWFRCRFWNDFELDFATI